MALRTINIGASANDGTGNTLRDSFDKTNQNFSELFSLVAATTTQNRIFASPDGSNGTPGFRALSLADIPTAGAATNQIIKYDGSNVVWGDILSVIYPVGAIYFSATSTVNPGTTLGFGTWVAIEGKVLVGYSSGETEFDALLETGGEKTHVLTEAELAAHTHLQAQQNQGFYYGDHYHPNLWAGNVTGGTEATSSTGSNTGHNNLQPYLTVSMWRRTA